MTSADCIRTRTKNGRNLTPTPVIKAARYVLGSIDLDPASDEVANEFIQAERIYTAEDDGFTEPWMADTVWLNPPGRTLSRGKYINAADWARKLYFSWSEGYVKHAVYMCYRGGSAGSLGNEFLNHPVCITCAGVESEAINGSGRLSFEEVHNGQRKPATANTQNSVIVLLSRNSIKIDRFKERFSQFGVVKV